MIIDNNGFVLLIIMVILIVFLVLIFITHVDENPPLVKNFYALGTIINLKVSGRNAEKAILEAQERLMDIDDKMSAFKDYSEISRINMNAGGLPQAVSEDTYFVIKKSVEYSKLSDGTFDPTIRPLVNLWSIGTKQERIPEKSEIEEKLKLVNYCDIDLNENDRTVKLEKQNQAIDMGGIAKGFAADEVRNIFLKYHIKSALIDLGGNIFALGKKTDATTWSIGIQNPYLPRGEFAGIINVENKSVVTSGNYERFFEHDDKKFHHIINPKTGYPSESKIISATIISDNSIDGDGLSTGAYIMGIDKAMKLVESVKGIDAIFITEDKEVYATSGIKQNFKLTNEEFTYIEK